MCGAYGFSDANFPESFLKRFEISQNAAADVRQSYNIRPTQHALIVTRNSPNKAESRSFGFPAPWNEKLPLFNAKSETISTLRTFKQLFAESRCLVPATNFYEWKRLEEPKMKQPYAFALKGRRMFAFAGIYTDQGFAIITTRPNKLMEDVHNRMPCILTQEEESRWLDHETSEEELLAMLQPFPDELMESLPVSSLVNSFKNNFPELLKEFKPLK